MGRLWLKLVAAIVLVAGIFSGGPAEAAAGDVGPVDPAFGFPAWFRDKSTTVSPQYPDGFPLQPCLDPGPDLIAPWCFLPIDAAGLSQEPENYDPLKPLSLSLLPDSITDQAPYGVFNGNFPGESFYYITTTVMNFDALSPADPTLTGTRLVYLAGVEAAFLGTGGPSMTLQFPFVRIRADLIAPSPGTYTIEHPYGTPITLKTTADNLKARYVSDIPVAMPNTLRNFLLPADSPGGAPNPLPPVNVGPYLYLADPARTGPVTNAPFGLNEVRITGPGLPGGTVRLTDFTIVAKMTAFTAETKVVPPASTDFGQVAVGASSQPGTFTISNLAGTPGGSVSVSGINTDNASFLITPSAASPCPTAFPFTLAPSTSCSFDVVFAPTGTPGAITGNVSVTSTPAAAPSVFAVRGTAVSTTPAVALLPETVGTRTVGASIGFSAQGGGPAPAYEFEFYLFDGTSWSVVQPYGAATAWVWDTSQTAPGDYRVKVRMRATGETAAAATSDSVAVTLIGFSVGVTADPAATTNSGIPVTFSATSTGGANLEYQFEILNAAGNTVIQPFSPLATCNWTTAGAPAGAYTLLLQAREAGSTVTRTAVTLPYQLLAPPTAVKSATLTASPASPAAAGTQITLTGRGNRGSGDYEYRFSQQVNGVWQPVQEWSRTATWAWDSTGVPAGPYHFQVEARSFGSSVVRTDKLRFVLR